MASLLAVIDPKLAAALIAGGVSIVVTLLTVFMTPVFRWTVERDLNRRQAKYAQELEELKGEHERNLEAVRLEHAHALQHAEAENQRELAAQNSQAEFELARSKADIDYELEQRLALRKEVGAFRGRLIEVGNSLNFRLDNIRENRSEVAGSESSEKWLDRGGRYRRNDEGGYYFVSTIYRFMAYVAVANRFERAAVYVDPRYGEPADEQVVFYVRALRWALTDPKLFAGLQPSYEQHTATDHFFTDDLRRMCAEVIGQDGALKEMHELELELEREAGPLSALQPALAFFDGLRAGSLRWDRLMAFGLLLKAFLNTIGYARMRSTQAWFDWTAASIHRPEIRANLLDWLPRLAIDTGEAAACVRVALERTGRTNHLVVPEPRSAAGDAAEPDA
jgi:hypothetical protein